MTKKFISKSRKALEKFDYGLSGITFQSFPIYVLKFTCYGSDGEQFSFPLRILPNGEWGKPRHSRLFEIEHSLPVKVDLVYYSVAEHCAYQLIEMFPTNAAGLWKTGSFHYIVVGMAPYGNVAIWLYSERRSELLTCFKAEKLTPKSGKGYHIFQDKGYCLPTQDYFSKRMCQYDYRYLFLPECWEGQSLRWRKLREKKETRVFSISIREYLTDGTHSSFEDENFCSFRSAGRPEKLALSWHEGRSEFAAYFWFDDERLCAVFDKFYGVHRDTRTDFIIRVDAAARKYELALFRYGLKEPVVIPEEAYQLLVFKNRFEDFRSPNYDLPRGAWIW